MASANKPVERKETTIDKFNKVIFEISENGLSLRKALEINSMSSRTFDDMIIESEENKQHYERAREKRADKIFEEILEISDDGTNDTIAIHKGETEFEIENKEWVNRSKLRVDARKWMLSKMLPKKYGEKIEVDNKGGINVNITQVTGMKII